MSIQSVLPSTGLLLFVLLFSKAATSANKPMMLMAKRELLPGSHYYLRSLSRTSRTFYFPDSRDLLEVLRDFLGRERGGVPGGSSRTLGDPPLGLSLCRGSPPENLEEVPRIWEGEGYRRSEIMNASNNDYWVGIPRNS